MKIRKYSIFIFLSFFPFIIFNISYLTERRGHMYDVHIIRSRPMIINMKTFHILHRNLHLQSDIILAKCARKNIQTFFFVNNKIINQKLCFLAGIQITILTVNIVRPYEFE